MKEKEYQDELVKAKKTIELLCKSRTLLENINNKIIKLSYWNGLWLGMIIMQLFFLIWGIILNNGQLTASLYVNLIVLMTIIFVIERIYFKRNGIW